MAVFLPVSGFAAVYTVCSGGCDFTTMAGAQAAASDGDTVDVRGNIDESLTWAKAVNITSTRQNITWTSTQPSGATLRINGTIAGALAWQISNLTINHSGIDGHTIDFFISITQHLTITNCTLMRSSTGTVQNAVLYNTAAFDNYTVNVLNSRIIGNADSYGINLTGGNMIPSYNVVNTIFSGFTGPAYAAIRDNTGSQRVNVALMNCDVVDNYYGFIKTNISLNSGSKIVNTVFAGNVVDAQGFPSLNPADFEYCAFQQIVSGLGTGCRYGIDPAAEFVDASAGNYHSSATSANVRNAGTATGAPAFDCEGIPRPQEGVFDIGIYEYNTFTPTYTPTVTDTFTATSTYTYTYSNTPTQTNVPTDTVTNTPTTKDTFTQTPNYTETAIAETQTAIAQQATPTYTETATANATLTAIAGTQTAIVETQTAIAQQATPTYTETATANATLTAIAGTQTAIAETQTAIAQQATPNYTETAEINATQTAIAVFGMATPSHTPSGGTIIVYPNPPVDGTSIVSYSGASGKKIYKVSVIINSIDGQKAAEYDETQIFDGKIKMNVAAFASGVYFVRLTLFYDDGTKERMHVGRLIITRR
jgi:hypothetical protein